MVVRGSAEGFVFVTSWLQLKLFQLFKLSIFLGQAQSVSRIEYKISANLSSLMNNPRKFGERLPGTMEHC